MFSNNWFLPKNGAKRELYSNQSISYRANYSSVPNLKKAPFGMETKLILTIGTWLGITSWVSAILLNAGTWKADVLWFMAVMFAVAKFIRYSIKTWQDFRKGEIEIKAQQKKNK